MEYPKIDTLFTRDTDFNVTGELRHPVIATIKEWDVQEKIDGTNIRVILSYESDNSPAPGVKFGGRTDRASMSMDLLATLQQMFPVDKLTEVFHLDEDTGRYPHVTIYGEGYGPGIQKGGGEYRADKSFRIFDILIDNKYWLGREQVDEIAAKLGVKTAPYLGRWTLEDIIAKVRVGIPSEVAAQESGKLVVSEGVVARPIEPLFDRRGKRIIIKLKTKDFTHGSNRTETSGTAE